MKFVDTHCHIHEPDYKLDLSGVDENSKKAGVDQIICVGTDVKTSREAVEFVQNRENSWASVGLHPHDAKEGEGAVEQLEELVVSDSHLSNINPSKEEFGEKLSYSALVLPVKRYPESDLLESHYNKIVAIGECGLDYFYENSPKSEQIKLLHAQIKLAQKYNLPLIFHVREAFNDFWPIFDSYKNLRGVLHSFTDNQTNLDKALERGLYIGVNGIATFAKNPDQLQVYKNIPLQKMLLETDAPFLTPNPFRGTVNEPAKVKVVAEFLATIRGESIADIAKTTTKNAQTLFDLKINIQKPNVKLF